MDTILLSQLDRVETALTTLVDSIATYNPSIPAAQSLIKADDDLQHNLKELHVHQRNHARIQQLQQTVERQDAQIKSTLQLLADTRAELLAVPNSLPPKDRRDVDVTQLLDFAKRITRFTPPSTFKPTITLSLEGLEDVTSDSQVPREGVGLAALVEEEKRWLDPWTGVHMTPWPSEEVIRSSALARTQAGEKLEDIEEAGSEQVGDKMQVDTIGDGEGGVQIKPRGGGAIVRQEEKPKVFGGLDLYDPEYDD